MSFDLAVWRNPGQVITPEEANATYVAMCARPFDSFVPSPEMTAFVEAVSVRLGGGAQDFDSGPWAAEPDVDQHSVIMAFRSSLGAEALKTVRDIARGSDLVCYDPQERRVYLPSDADVPASASLDINGGKKVDDPSDVLIEKTVRGVSRDRWYAILDLGQGRYIQIGYGESAGAPAGQYAIEYRDGSPDGHWRAITSDIEACVRAFLEYRAGEMNWTKRLPFNRISI